MTEITLIASAIQAATVTDVVTLADINETLNKIDDHLWLMFIALCAIFGAVMIK